MFCLKPAVLLTLLLPSAVVARPSMDREPDSGFTREAEGSAAMFQQNSLRFQPEGSFSSPRVATAAPTDREESTIPEAWSRFLFTDSGARGTRPRPVTAHQPVPYDTNFGAPAKSQADEDDDFVPKREQTISKTLSQLTDDGRVKKHHGKDHGSCLLAVIFEAIEVPDETMEKLEENDENLHEKENEIWQQLLDIMALDFIPVEDDEEYDTGEEEDDEEEYDEDYYEYYEDEYDYECEEGTECGDDTVQDNDFAVMSFPPMMT